MMLSDGRPNTYINYLGVKPMLLFMHLTYCPNSVPIPTYVDQKVHQNQLNRPRTHYLFT